MLQHLLAAVFVLLVSSSDSSIPAPNQCITRESLRSSLTENIPGVELTRLDGADVTTFLALFNTVPPSTHVQAETILIASVGGGPQIVIGFFTRDCMTGRAVLPRGIAKQILLHIERSGA